MLKYLRGHVDWGTDASFCHAVQLAKIFGKTEVTNFENTLMDQHISRLEISMDNTLPNNRPEAVDKLIENLKGLLFGKFFIVGISFKVSIFAEFKNKINGVSCGYSVDELNDITMLEFFHDGDLGAE